MVTAYKTGRTSHTGRVNPSASTQNGGLRSLGAPQPNGPLALWSRCQPFWLLCGRQREGRRRERARGLTETDRLGAGSPPSLSAPPVPARDGGPVIDGPARRTRESIHFCHLKSAAATQSHDPGHCGERSQRLFRKHSIPTASHYLSIKRRVGVTNTLSLLVCLLI